jgi:hypothetical protein
MTSKWRKITGKWCWRNGAQGTDHPYLFPFEIALPQFFSRSFLRIQCAYHGLLQRSGLNRRNFSESPTNIRGEFRH